MACCESYNYLILLDKNIETKNCSICAKATAGAASGAWQVNCSQGYPQLLWVTG
jgi:hypothetical protein